MQTKTEARAGRRGDREILRDVADLIDGGASDEFPSGTVEALNRAIGALEVLSPQVLASVRAVVAYDWATEERDYQNASRTERKGHIYLDLRCLRAFARKCASRGL